MTTFSYNHKIYYNDTILQDSIKDLKECSFADKLKKYRLLANLTQDQLAELAGIDRITVVDLETGKNAPSLKLCDKLGQALNIDPKLLYDEYLIFISGDYGFTISDTRKKLNLKPTEFSKLLDIDRHVLKNGKNVRLYL